MKIGIVLASTPAYSETFFISKIKGLQQYGYEVVLFVNNQKGKFDLCEVKNAPIIHGFGIFKSLIGFLLLLLIKPFTLWNFVIYEKQSSIGFGQLVKKVFLNQHILYANNLDWLHFGFATQTVGRENIAKVLGAKMAVSLRGFDIAIYPLKYLNCYDLLWERIDKLHVISNDLHDCALKNGLHPNTNYQKITPAIDVEKFHNTNIKKKTSTATFVTVGRLHWKKGYTDTLLALKIVQDKGIDFNYTIIGSGADYERIAYAIHDLDLTDRVTLLGQLTQDQIKEKLAITDFYIQYSVQEGFCNAVLEAQAMGVLPIVSDAEGLSENVLNQETGWVVPKCKPDLLAKQLLASLDISEEEKNKMQQKGIQRVTKEFNIEKQQVEFVQFYSS